MYYCFSSDITNENDKNEGDEIDVEGEDEEDFSFLDETDYVIYEDCYDSEESWEECDKAYKFGGKDYYDYEETLKDFNKTTKNSKKSSPTPDEKSSKHGKLGRPTSWEEVLW